MPDPTDGELIVEWKRLQSAGTPGKHEAVREPRGCSVAAWLWVDGEESASFTGALGMADAELFAFAANHSARLLAMVERLKAERDSYETLAERLANEVAELRYGADDSDWGMPASQGGGE